MHGIGRNFEMNNNFYSFYFQKIFKKFIATTQFYQLYSSLASGPSAGIAQKISFVLSKKIKLNGFLNKSILCFSSVTNKAPETSPSEISFTFIFLVNYLIVNYVSSFIRSILKLNLKVIRFFGCNFRRSFRSLPHQ